MDITPLREELASLHDAGEKLVNLAATEKRDFSEAEKADFDKQIARANEVKNLLDRQSQLAAFAFSSNQNIELPTEPAGREEQEALESRVGKTFDRKNKISRDEYCKHLNHWVRTGDISRQFATITGSTQSGILMPVDVMPPITPAALNVFREALSAYGMDAWKTPSTRNINLPIFTSSAGAAVDPTDTDEVEQEPALSESVNSVITTYHSGNVWFENRDLMAVDFDLMSESVPALVYSKELAFESAIVTALNADSGITQSVATATTSGFTYGNLVSLKNKLPKRYQNLKVIVLSKPAYSAAENLTTTTGFPILNQDAQNQNLKRFNGVPVVYSEYLSDFGANNIVGYIFSWVGTRLRDGGEGNILQRFTQTANRQGQTGIDLYGYHAFNYATPSLGIA